MEREEKLKDPHPVSVDHVDLMVYDDHKTKKTIIPLEEEGEGREGEREDEISHPSESDNEDDEENEGEDDEDIETTLQDVINDFIIAKSSLETLEMRLQGDNVTKENIYEVKSSLASLNGDLEDVQYDLDGLSIENVGEKAQRKYLLTELSQLFEKILFLDNKCTELLELEAERLKKIGNDHFKENNNEMAIEFYTAAIRLNPSVPQYYTNRALAHQKLQNYEKAIDDAKYSLRLDVNYLKGYVILMKCHLVLKSFDSLLEVRNRVPNEFLERSEVVELNNSSAAVCKEVGNGYFKQGNMDEAIRYYSLAIEFTPSNHLLYSNRSAAYQSKGMWKESLNDGEKSVHICETFMKGYVHIARSQIQLQRWDDAEVTVALATKLFQSSPDFSTISQQLDEISTKIRNGKGVQSRENTIISPQVKAEQFKQKGNQYYKEEDYQEAIKYYTQAISLCPSESAYYGNRSAAWMMLKEYKRAIADCIEGIKNEQVAGQQDKLRLRHSTALASMGSIDQAILVLEEGITLPGRQDQSLKSFSDQLTKYRETKTNLQLAQESLARNEFTRSKRLFENLLGTLTDDPVTSIGLAKAYFNLGQFEDASRAAQKGIAAGGHLSIEAYIIRADSLHATGCTDLAQKHLVAALQMDPDNNTLQTKLKSLRKLVSETTRIRQLIDTSMNSRKFDEAIRNCTEGLQLEGITRKLLGEFHQRRSKAYSMKAKLALRGATDDSASDQTDPQALWKRCLQDANSSIYYDRSEASLLSLFLKCEALQGLGRHEEALEELQSCYENGPGQGDETVKQKHKEAQFLLKKSKRVDLYKLLGCPRGELSSEKEIRLAYKKAALKWHPDRHSNADEQTKKEVEKKFKEISDAHELLTDPQRKALYDQGYDREEIEQRMEMQNQQRQHGGYGYGYPSHGGYRR